MRKYMNDLDTIIAQYRRGLRDVDGLHKGFTDILWYASHDTTVSRGNFTALVEYISEMW